MQNPQKNPRENGKSIENRTWDLGLGALGRYGKVPTAVAPDVPAPRPKREPPVALPIAPDLVPRPKKKVQVAPPKADPPTKDGASTSSGSKAASSGPKAVEGPRRIVGPPRGPPPGEDFLTEDPPTQEGASKNEVKKDDVALSQASG